MKEIYELIEIGKKRQGIESDRGYALANGLHNQLVADVKSGKSMPNAENMLKILAAAGLSVNEGLAAIERQKQAGIADIGLMLGIAGGAAVVMSLAEMTPLPYAAFITTIAGLGYVYYVK